MAKINISIPQPCHENWEAMAPEDKGKFCASCQKKVFDFTNASDREIVTSFQKDENLCGRFLESQLNRDLIKPEKKNPFWLATTSAVISLIGLSSQEASAQQKTTPTEHTTRVLLGKPAPPKNNMDSTKKEEIITNPELEISGVVSDKAEALPGVSVIIKGKSNSAETDFDGKFRIKAKIGDTLVFNYPGYSTLEYNVIDSKNITLEMKSTHVFMGEIVVKRRTFFGRIFHSIGNLFR